MFALLLAVAFAGPEHHDPELWSDWFAPNSEKPLTGDFDGDGLADVVTITSAGHVYVSLSDGHGAFAQVGWYWGTWWSKDAQGRYHTADVDGDGKDDLIHVKNDASGDVYARLSTGTSFAATRNDLWDTYMAADGESHVFGDFTGDGCADMASINRYYGYLMVAPSNCVDRFDTPAVWATGFTPGAELDSGDFNGDGCDDVVQRSGTTVRRVHTASCIQYTQSGTVPIGFGSAVVQNVVRDAYMVVADVDGDGRDDILQLDFREETATWNRSNISNFSATAPLHDMAPWGVKFAADVDGDGFADLIHIKNNSSGDVFVYRSNPFGEGTLSEGTNYGPTRGVQPVLVIMSERAPGDSWFTQGEISDLWFAPSNSFREYFAEMSEGRYLIEPAEGDGVVGPYVLATPLGSGFSARVELAREAIRAADADVDFSDYDEDGDGTVDAAELRVFVHNGIPGASGASGGTFCVSVDGVSVCPGRGTHGAQEASAMTHVHEYMHGMGAVDLYGPTRSGMRISAMSTTEGLAGSLDPGSELTSQMWHLDPWHKLRMGWLTPRVMRLDRRDGAIELRAASLPGQDFDQTVLFYDPDAANPTRQYYLVEFRRRPLFFGEAYEGYVPDNGMAIWRVQTDANHDLLDWYDENGGHWFTNWPMSPTGVQGHAYLWSDTEGAFPLDEFGALAPEIEVLNGPESTYTYIDSLVVGFSHTCKEGRNPGSTCSPSCPCSAGQLADCDSHADCADGLVCRADLGPEVGLPSWYDICVDSCHDTPIGSLSYCSEDCPCDEGLGDCDTDAQCRDGLVCAHQTGVDYCERPN